MNPTVVGLAVLASTFGGALFGMWLRNALPGHHISAESTDVVKLAMGLISTITALVLGLVIASAKNSFDDEDTTMRQSAAVVLTLDRALARYGPETADIRNAIRNLVAEKIEMIWPQGDTKIVNLNSRDVMLEVEAIEDQIRNLVPKSDTQRWYQSQAVQLGSGLLETRWLVLERAHGSIPVAFLIILTCWLALIFASFGLYSRRNATILMVLFVCAVSVSAAVFLILEMEGQFHGLIKVSSEPLRYALSQLGQ